MSKQSYRTIHQIYADVLAEADTGERSGIAVTVLCRKANLPHGRLKNCIKNLTSSGLMNEIKYDGKNTFVITSKGKLYLEEYQKFSGIAESFGLEL